MSVLTVHPDMRAGLRALLLTAQKATTGTRTDISVAGSTYTRQTGSFLDDGFGQGDEIVASGFVQSGNSGQACIVELSATTMRVNRTLTTESAGANVQIVAGLPLSRAWEAKVFSPVKGVPYVSESFRPQGSRKVSAGANGTIRHNALMVINLNYPGNEGPLAAEMMAGVLLNLFKPGTAINYGPDQKWIERVEQAPIVQGVDFITLPVTVHLVGYTTS